MTAEAPLPRCFVEGKGADERVELHVLVRAYCAAWVALHSKNPTGTHRLEQLGVTLRFEEPES